jgi:hypothetical protein
MLARFVMIAETRPELPLRLLRFSPHPQDPKAGHTAATYGTTGSRAIGEVR